MPVTKRALIGVPLVALALLVAVSPTFVSSADAAPVLPPGFSDSFVVAAARPTGLVFTPDDRMLLITQPGYVYVMDQGEALPATPTLDLSSKVCSNKERGLLAVTVDPGFTDHGYVYFFYTHNSNPCAHENRPDVPMNRVSRFTLSADGSIDPDSEVVLMDGIPSVYGWHDGGDLGFGANGLLYVSVGDGSCQIDDSTRCQILNNNARRLDLALGKILRIAPDGSVPSTNPFSDARGARRCASPTGPEPGDGPCSETFAWGLRNPFRFAFEPGTNRFLINDVGENRWEEIDASKRGADYGWNVREGHCLAGSYTDCPPPPAGMTDPLYDYSHSATGGCAAITGGAFVPPGEWPDTYEGDYLFSDYVCGRIFRLERAPDGTASATTFASNLSYLSAIDLAFGPHAGGRSLYYTSYAGGGQVRRIDYDPSGNAAPSASFTAAPTYGALPLDVAFDASASGDPEGDALTYVWDFGDGSPAVETQSPMASHTYTTAGAFDATLRVRDEYGHLSGADTQRIDAGNEPPNVTITAPADDYRFAVGDDITLEATAVDPQEGPLAGNAIEWEVLYRHADHYHPHAEGAGSSITITAPTPHGLAAAANSHLEVFVTAADSRGAEGEERRALLPATVDVTFDTTPDGRAIEVNGDRFRGDRALTSWVDYALNVSMPRQSFRDLEWRFASWGDGAANPRTIVTPESASAYRSVLRPIGSIGPHRCFGIAPTMEGTRGSDRLVGTTGRDVVAARGGADVVRGLDGFDVVCAGGGADVVRGGPGMDALDGGRGDDRLLGGSGFDYAYGRRGRDECSAQVSTRC